MEETELYGGSCNQGIDAMSEDGRVGFELLPSLLWETIRKRAIAIVVITLPATGLLLALGIFSDLAGRSAPIGLLDASSDPWDREVFAEVAGRLAEKQRSFTSIPSRTDPGEEWCIDPWTSVLAIGGDDAIVRAYVGMCKPSSLTHVVRGSVDSSISTRETLDYKKVVIRLDDLAAALRLLEVAGPSPRIGIILEARETGEMPLQALDRGHLLANKLRSRGYRIARVTHRELGRERFAIDIPNSSPVDLRAWSVRRHKDGTQVAWEVAVEPLHVARLIVERCLGSRAPGTEELELTDGFITRSVDVPFWDSPLEP
jgi:hypothetical protein